SAVGTALARGTGSWFLLAVRGGEPPPAVDPLLEQRWHSAFDHGNGGDPPAGQLRGDRRRRSPRPGHPRGQRWTSIMGARGRQSKEGQPLIQAGASRSTLRRPAQAADSWGHAWVFGCGQPRPPPQPRQNGPAKKAKKFGQRC